MRLSKRRIFYVYVLLDPRKPGVHRYGRWVFHHEPFYVGKGKSEKRVFNHLNPRQSRNNLKNNKIQKILREGHGLLYTIKRRKLTEKQALDLESRIITRIGRINTKAGPLTNLTDGGEGVSGAVVRASSKRKELATKAAKSDEEKADILRRQLETKAAKSDKVKKQEAAQRRKTFLNRSPEKKQASLEKRRATFAKKAKDGWKRPVAGEKHWTARRSGLTLKDARKIRRSSEPCRLLAQQYGISPMAVSRIKNGLTWVET